MECLKIYFLVDSVVPEGCIIFCWQVMKMFHLFLTSGNLKYTFEIFSYTEAQLRADLICLASHVGHQTADCSSHNVSCAMRF